MSSERAWIPPRALDMTLISMVLVAWPHHERLPDWYWLLLIVSILIARSIVSGRAQAPPRWILTLPVVATVGALFHDFDSLLTPEGGVAFLLVAFCGKLIEARSSREARVLQLLLLFVAPLQLLFDTSISAALMCLLAVFSSLVAIIQTQGGLSTPRVWTAARMAGLALLQALPVMIVLFVFFPRLAPLWSLPKPGASGSVGFSDDLDLGRLGSLSDNPAIAFRVRFEGDQPDGQHLYWRMSVLDSLEGDRWFWKKGRVGTVPTANMAGDRAYTVFPEPGQLAYVPHLEPLLAPGDRPLNAYEGSVMPMPDRQSRTPWNLFTSDNQEGPSEPLRSVNDGHLLRLPPAIAPRTRALAREWSAQGYRDPAALVERFSAWVKEQQFLYTLEPPTLAGDVTDAFMFEHRQGYCSHYANALALMLRESGTPARIIAGFQGAEFNAGGGYWIIRQSDAHAWVEYASATGHWVRVDPTVFVAPDRIRLGSRVLQENVDLFGLEIGNPRHWTVFNRLTNAVDYLNYQWITKVVSYDATRQERLLDLLPRVGGLSMQLVWLAAGLAVTVVFGIMLLRWPGSKPRLSVERRLLDRLLDEVAKLHGARHPGQTPLAYASDVGRRHPEVGLALEAFLDMYYQREYGGSRITASDIPSQTGHGATDTLMVLYRHCLRSLRKQAPRGIRAR